jgi:hypothetical protein
MSLARVLLRLSSKGINAMIDGNVIKFTQKGLQKILIFGEKGKLTEWKSLNPITKDVKSFTNEKLIGRNRLTITSYSGKDCEITGFKEINILRDEEGKIERWIKEEGFPISKLVQEGHVPSRAIPEVNVNETIISFKDYLKKKYVALYDENIHGVERRLTLLNAPLDDIYNRTVVSDVRRLIK